MQVQAQVSPVMAPVALTAQGLQGENDLFRQMSVVHSSNEAGQATLAPQAVEQPSQPGLPAHPEAGPRPAQAVLIEPDVMQVPHSCPLSLQTSVVHSKKAGQAALAPQAVEQPSQPGLPVQPEAGPRPAQAVVIEPDVMQVRQICPLFAGHVTARVACAARGRAQACAGFGHSA